MYSGFSNNTDLSSTKFYYTFFNWCHKSFTHIMNFTIASSSFAQCEFFKLPKVAFIIWLAQHFFLFINLCVVWGPTVSYMCTLYKNGKYEQILSARMCFPGELWRTLHSSYIIYEYVFLKKVQLWSIIIMNCCYFFFSFLVVQHNLKVKWLHLLFSEKTYL